MARPNVVRRSLLCAGAFAMLLGAAGCGADTEGGGGPDADTQVRTVVARFGVATREKDYQEICDRLLSDELIAKIETIGLPCESALQRGLGDVQNPTLAINEVSISGSRALVSIHTTATGQPPSDDALQLVRQGGAWKIASLAAPGGTQTQTTTTPTTPTTTATTRTTTTSR
ncbi:MAG: nuclear transport factor 2 family protein [Conexibacter sp.]|nr:nuclear transport factor 2 family protein [Conexibacter sp.]